MQYSLRYSTLTLVELITYLFKLYGMDRKNEDYESMQLRTMLK